jgi:uncharacterized protein (UPF0335 family)
MAAEVITREDLQLFRIQLLEELKEFISQFKKEVSSTAVEGYKTKQVRKILDCSTNKLQSLRISGKLRSRKVGGTIYYKPEDVQKLLNDGC